MSNRAALLLMVGVAGLIVGAYLFYSISNSSYTFGCDYLTYDAAARRWLAGSSPYDLTGVVTGDCGTYQYPPTVLLLAAPVTLLATGAACIGAVEIVLLRRRADYVAGTRPATSVAGRPSMSGGAARDPLAD